MDYITRINQACEFIESNLRDEINTADVAYNSSFSLYHFHRIFRALTGYTLKRYIRLRRMTEAARELLFSSKSIIDIALDYQFESQESFSRSFKDIFSVSPGKYRKRRICFDTQFQNMIILNKNASQDITIAGITETENVTIAGYRYIGSNMNGEITALWKKLNRCAKNLFNKSLPIRGYGLCIPNDTCAEEELDYFAGVKISSIENIPHDMELYSMHAHLYMIFTAIGIHNIVPTYQYAVGTCMSKVGYEWNYEIPDFEYYTELFDSRKPYDSPIDLYIPVRKI